MYKKCKVFFILFICALLMACGNGNDSATEENITNNQSITNISANKLIDQDPSNQVKDILKTHDEVTGIKAANTSKDIIIAAQIKHSHRFQLEKIKEELTKEVKEKLKNFHVELTIDKKIYLELEKLEEQIQSKSITPSKLGKEIDRITKLSKEKT